MSQQIQITGGAKVRDLQDVIIGTSGVLSSLAFNVANGVPKLDSGGKILVSQLPNSVMEYKGTWNAATNTPTLVNGTGNQGDVYLCNVAGTVDFGAGAIAFVIGDQVIYSGSIWQRASGATGTVTSVAVTESGDSLNITGSPITTSGTINIGFNGTNLQYVNGAGNLTTFPTLMTSVGLTMPSAFTVTNSPLTGAGGTLAVTGAGTTAQYIDGTGALQTFPSIISQATNLVTEVYNNSGATLTKGTVVYITGGQGNLPTISKALATGDLTSAQTYGIVQTNITNMNNGYVVVAGRLSDLDTQAYSNGTQLYLSSTTAGEYTSTKQYAPNHLVYVGIVVRSHPTQGVIEVKIQNGYEMDELHNVSAQSPLNNQGLFYNTSTSLWENKSIATALGYTPANDSLVVHLAGTETITGEKTFTNVNGTQFDYGIVSPLTSRFDQGIIFKKGTVPTIFTTITTNLYSESTSNNLVIQDSSSKAKLLFNNSTQTYTFPASSGTISLTSDLANYVDLTTAQTITGAKTFTGSATFNSSLGNSIILNYGAALVKGNTPSSTSGVWSNIYAAAGSNNLVIADNANTSKLQFQAASTYTYTFPAATGTLALTSDLSSYVPYTGATGAVNLGNYELTSSNLIAGGTSGNAGMLHLKSDVALTSKGNGYTSIGAYAGSGIIQFQMYTGASTYKSFTFSIGTLTDNTNRQFTLPNASGTLALTSDLSGYLPLAGGTLTGALSGTSATFSGKVGIGATPYASTTAIIRAVSATSTNYALIIEDNASNQLFEIKNNGAATFSSSVGVGNVTPYSILSLPSGTGWNGGLSWNFTASGAASRKWWINTDQIEFGDFRICTEKTQGGGTISNASTLNERLYINASGNVGIGTSSPITFANTLTLHMNGGSNGSFFTMAGSGTRYLTILAQSGEGKIETNTAIPLILATNETERMRITSDGNLLLGTTDNGSGAKLVFYSTSAAQQLKAAGTAPAITFSNTITSPTIGGVLGAATAAGHFITGTAAGDMVLANQFSSGSLIFGTSNVERMRIINNGNISMATSVDYGYKLNLNGQPGCNGYTAWTNWSDSRLKENVTDFDATNVLDKICAIRPVTYNYNELSGFDEETRARRISGFIAQELKEIFPDMVGTIKKDNVEYYDTNLSNLDLYIVKAIQQLAAEIKTLKNK